MFNYGAGDKSRRSEDKIFTHNKRKKKEREAHDNKEVAECRTVYMRDGVVNRNRVECFYVGIRSVRRFG